MRKAVFLDRDGVINRAVLRDGKAYTPTTLENFEIIPGVEEAIRSLRDAGFLIIVVTNQPDVATGIQSQATVNAMHSILFAKNLCDDVKVCFHTDLDKCECRKPKPGMLLAAAREWNIDLKRSFMVGDRWRDISAGVAAGCFTFFIDYNYKEQRPEQPDAVVQSLQEASIMILSDLVRGGRFG